MSSQTLAASNSLSDLLSAAYSCQTFHAVQSQLLPHFKNFLSKSEGQMGELIMGSLLEGGGGAHGDPLTNMGFGDGRDVQASMMTLGALFFLSARLGLPHPPPTTFTTINAFCIYFDPHQARLAPSRVTKLARGIQRWAEMNHDPAAAISPLRALLTKYPPSLSYLTTIHPIFIQTCCTTRHFTQALPILQIPIQDVDTSLSDLHYTDNLIYHYTGGVTHAALKRFADAAEFFEIVVSSPCSVPSAIQIEAYKKLALVQLILYGKVSQPPKYTPPTVTRMFKNSQNTLPYIKFINAFENSNRDLVMQLLRDTEAFRNDNNLGLAHQAFERMPWLAIKRLKETFMKLSLNEIGSKVGLSANWEDPRGVRSLIVSMIAAGELSASISPDGTVSFDEEDVTQQPQPSKVQLEYALSHAREAVERLGELDRSIGRSKEYIQKALHARDSGMGWQEDESIMPPMRGGDLWDDLG